MLQYRAEQTKGEERPGGQVAEDLEKKTGFCCRIGASGSSAVAQAPLLGGNCFVSLTQFWGICHIPTSRSKIGKLFLERAL